MESNCYDIKIVNQPDLQDDEIAIEATNHAREKILMIVKKNQIDKIYGVSHGNS